MSFNVSVKESIGAPSAPAAPQSGAERAKAMLAATMQAQTTPVNPNVPPVNNSNVPLDEAAAAGFSKTPAPQAAAAAETSQETTSEAAPEATTAARGPNLSPQYAQLARQEKMVRAAQAALKRDQAAFRAAQEAAKAPPPQTYDPTRHIDRDALKSDPFKVLADLGLTYDQLTQQALNAPSPEQVQLNQTIAALRSEINDLKQAQEKVNKTFEETQTQSYQQALNQIRSDARKLVNTDPAFETIKTTGSINEVVELIEKTFAQDKDEYGNPVLLTVEEAAKLVEDEISERLYTYANRVDKIKKRFSSPVAPAGTPVRQQQQQEPKTQQQRPTLTNQIATSGKLTAKERAVMAGKFGPDWREKVGA